MESGVQVLGVAVLAALCVALCLATARRLRSRRRHHRQATSGGCEGDGCWMFPENSTVAGWSTFQKPGQEAASDVDGGQLQPIVGLLSTQEGQADVPAAVGSRICT
eukprot:CAMPEP_0173426152 /NCGR_PEP_ID=MMETSP1357-20121228/5690_1 /TAXON_ID=77926 /ORGANISM="Hemiselmis rufescens, Strain PCC563" /LENGTH=105 /DNA_ID=CAMNT_0014389745 /DNA_START=381 /DNA_END=698 /DNA_ORIENTATION=-